MGAHPSHDRAIARIASRQHGVISRAQLDALGLGRGAIRRRMEADRLLPVHRGVYAVGYRATSRESAWMAAVLAGGDGALLSTRSAAVLWGLRTNDGARPDVTIPRAARRERPAIAIHRATLAAADRGMRLGIPVTSVARTLTDLAHLLGPEELTRAVREAEFRRMLHPFEVRDALTRRPSAALARLVDDSHPTQTVLEDRLLAVCRRHRLPRPQSQVPVAGHRVDFIWPEQRLAVEVDGWQAHRTRDAFQRDRAEGNVLGLNGYLVLRFTWQDLRSRPTQVARQIAAGLRR